VSAAPSLPLTLTLLVGEVRPAGFFFHVLTPACRSPAFRAPPDLSSKEQRAGGRGEGGAFAPFTTRKTARKWIFSPQYAGGWSGPRHRHVQCSHQCLREERAREGGVRRASAECSAASSPSPPPSPAPASPGGGGGPLGQLLLSITVEMLRGAGPLLSGGPLSVPDFLHPTQRISTDGDHRFERS